MIWGYSLFLAMHHSRTRQENAQRKDKPHVIVKTKQDSLKSPQPNPIVSISKSFSFLSKKRLFVWPLKSATI